MRPAGSRRRFLAQLAAVATLGFMLVTGVTLVRGPAVFAAAPGIADTITPITVGIDRVLSRITDPVTVDISGQLGLPLAGTKLVVRVKGPAGFSQIMETSPELPEIDKVVVELGQASSTTDTTAAIPTPSSGELTAGTLSMSVTLPALRPDQPGAYLLVVEVKSGTEIVARGQTWVGKVVAQDAPLELAFVWPLSLGIHRNAAGQFYDRVLENALGLPASGGAAASQVGVMADTGTLRGMAGLAERFPGWRFTLAIEPVLLAQLRDMADGYIRLDDTGTPVTVTADYVAAQAADALLAAFKNAAARDSVEVLVSPYAGADLGVLAAEGWRDGFAQIQLGKQELQQTLDLDDPITGAYSPDLGLTSGSLSSYADASIDHVVVDAGLSAMLTEPVEEGVVAVRARDEENDRVSLVLADTALGSVLASPSDPDLLFVVLAAELAAAPRNAFVITPSSQFTLLPDPYLESIGQALAGLDWVRTETLAELLRAHPAGTRPVMLRTAANSTPGYIESSLREGLRAAHDAVADLVSVADATRAPVEAALHLLYAAESRWWWRDGTSPAEATTGLEYSRQAEKTAETELAKVRFSGADSSLIAGHEGVVTLVLENGAAYPVAAGMELRGTGLTLPDGETLALELQPGRTKVPVRVVATDGEHKLDARLLAGRSVLDEVGRSVRFVTIGTVLPAIIVGGLALLAGLIFVMWRMLKKRGLHRPGVPSRVLRSRKGAATQTGALAPTVPATSAGGPANAGDSAPGSAPGGHPGASA
jgi:hypothetical protein